MLSKIITRMPIDPVKIAKAIHATGKAAVTGKRRHWKKAGKRLSEVALDVVIG